MSVSTTQTHGENETIGRQVRLWLRRIRATNLFVYEFLSLRSSSTAFHRLTSANWFTVVNTRLERNKKTTKWEANDIKHNKMKHKPFELSPRTPLSSDSFSLSASFSWREALLWTDRQPVIYCDVKYLHRRANDVTIAFHFSSSFPSLNWIAMKTTQSGHGQKCDSVSHLVIYFANIKADDKPICWDQTNYLIDFSINFDFVCDEREKNGRRQTKREKETKRKRER